MRGTPGTTFSLSRYKHASPVGRIVPWLLVSLLFFVAHAKTFLCASKWCRAMRKFPPGPDRTKYFDFTTIPATMLENGPQRIEFYNSASNTTEEGLGRVHNRANTCGVHVTYHASSWERKWMLMIGSVQSDDFLWTKGCSEMRDAALRSSAAHPPSPC